MFAMFLVDVLIGTRQWPSDPPDTLADTPVPPTNCETQQRRLFLQIFVFHQENVKFPREIVPILPKSETPKWSDRKSAKVSAERPLR